METATPATASTDPGNGEAQNSFASPTAPSWADPAWGGPRTRAHPHGNGQPPPGSYPGGPGGPAARPHRRSAGIVALVATGALLGGTGGVVAGSALNGSGSGASVTLGATGAVSSAPSTTTASGQSAASVAAAVLPSVVVLDVTGGGQSDTGSGVVLSSDGYLLTNNHVVTAAVSGGTVRATFNDGSTAAARIVGTDAASDLAVVKVDRTGLRAAKLGRSATLKVGDPVLAIGSPLGLSGTVTSGIVSALDRPVTTSDSGSGGSGGSSDPSAGGSTDTTVLDAIQTDAAVNPGNSGGPLVDMAGQVIGINSAIASLGSGSSGSQSGSIGVGFAIPVDQATVIAGQLIKTGHASHAVLGVSVADATTAGGTSQALLRQVSAGGPAAKAGLGAGDVITRIGTTPITTTESLIATVRTHQPGERVQVTYQRGGTTRTVTATLADASATG